VPTPTLIVDVDFGHQRSGVSGGTVAGVVISTLAVFVLVVIAVVVLLVIFRKLRRSKRLERMQWDILAL
jgi:Flp pilus assembly protein TadB